MHRDLQRRHIGLRPHLRWQLEHAREHGRHQLGVGDAVLGQQGQVMRWVEVLHDHHRAAVADGQADVGQRRRVVERCRRQVAHALLALPQLVQKAEQRQRLAGRGLGQRPQDALGPAGGARGIQHRRAQGFVGDRRVRAGRHGAGVVGHPGRARPALHASTAAHHQAQGHLRAVGQGLARHRQLVGRGDQQARFAVVEDVGQLVGLQVAIDAGVVQPAALTGDAGLHIAAVVLHEHGVVAQPLQAGATQQVRQAVAAGFQRAIGHGLAAAGHDEGGAVGKFLGVCAGVHAGSCRGKGCKRGLSRAQAAADLGVARFVAAGTCLRFSRCGIWAAQGVRRWAAHPDRSNPTHTTRTPP